MKIVKRVAVVILMLATACSKEQVQEIYSPDGKINVKIKIIKGELFYSVTKNNQAILLNSKLGIQFRNMKALDTGFEIISTENSSFSQTWEQPWGERRFVENNYHEMILHVQEKRAPERKMDLIFRVFNDGLGFRYFIPGQDAVDSIIISCEETEFKLPVISNAWWIPAYKEKFYESLNRYSPINKMDTVCTPITIETGNNSYISIHEANLTDYAAMNLYCRDTTTLTCDLTPWSTGEKVKSKAPMFTPWRTILIADKPGDLITSCLMLNLNEPSKIKDTSWLKPGKYIGIWWGMHQQKYTWSQGPNHGATTENAIRYIDFAAANNFDGVLIEGWNEGWDGDWTINGDKFSFTKPYPDFDIKKVTDYAARKHVNLIGHHETGGATINYENQLEEAFKFYKENGVNYVKTGYVSQKLDGKEYHSSQYGVRHYRKVIETAARYQIIIDNHEPVMPTGLCRTYPNLMTQEGVRGQEWDAWSTDGGNPPDHTTIVPFVRGLAGPMDFTFGTFDFKNPILPNTRVRTTLAKQIALYMVIYSPLQMASDLPENYKKNEAFNFLLKIPTDWEETKVLDARIGDYVIIARKDRNSDDWFIGAITDENARTLTIDLSFLTSTIKYKTQLIADASDANWKNNPTAIQYKEIHTNSTDTLELKLAPGGGQAIRLIQEK